jgi:hypothetical protein
LPAAEHAEYHFKDNVDDARKSQLSREDLWMAILTSNPCLADCMKERNQAWRGPRKAAKM